MAEEQQEAPAAPVRLSLRAQLTIWFGISFGAVLATIVGGLVMLDQGRLFDPTREDYDWLIRLVGIGTFAALVGGVLAAWVIGGVALVVAASGNVRVDGLAPVLGVSWAPSPGALLRGEAYVVDGAPAAAKKSRRRAGGRAGGVSTRLA